jgi:hypothetical protein
MTVLSAFRLDLRTYSPVLRAAPDLSSAPVPWWGNRPLFTFELA